MNIKLHVFGIFEGDFRYFGSADEYADAADMVAKAECGEIEGAGEWLWETHRNAGQDWKAPPTAFNQDFDDDDVDWMGQFFIWAHGEEA